ncbi:MAG: hypothetical protein R3182_05700, partial [Draconibacterium sp.]|nr:hypothetical protein [Draconibacterium sp.]
ELYNLEKDPMEWTNLASKNSKEFKEVKIYLRSFLPGKNANMIPAGDKDKTIKTIDKTIKPKRKLENLN